MRKVVGVAAVFLLIQILLLGCKANVIEMAATAPSPAATPAPSRTPIPVPWPTNYTPPPPYVPPPSPTPYVSDWVPSPIHPDLLPLVVYDWPPDNEIDSSPATLIDAALTPNNKPEFCPDDMIAGGLSLGMTQEEVLAVMGLPAKAYAYIDEMWVYEHLELVYESGDILRFDVYSDNNTYELNRARILSEMPGPRGLRLGDTLDDVLNAFRVDPESAGPLPYGDGTILYANKPYRGDSERDTDYIISPYGLVTYSGYYGYGEAPTGKIVVGYCYPSEPFPMMTYGNMSIISDGSTPVISPLKMAA